MIRTLVHVLAILVLVLVLAACGGDDAEDGTNGEAAPPPPAAEEADGEEAAARPETPLVATLDEVFNVVNGQSEPADESASPFPPGSVEAHWYRSGDRYVAVYVDVPTDAGPVCVGNSISAGDGALEAYSSNSPAAPDACPEWLPPNLISSEEVQGCGDVLVHVSEIPADETGLLRAGLGRYEGDTITGITGTASTDDGEAPEVDLAELGC